MTFFEKLRIIKEALMSSKVPDVRADPRVKGSVSVLRVKRETHSYPGGLSFQLCTA